METSLHRSLKQLYSVGKSRIEAVIGSYRADVLLDDMIVEIQASPLGAISRKIADLVQKHRVLVVKPITHRRVIVRQSPETGEWDQRRLSPKRGALIEVFDDLVNFTRVFPHPNLTVEVVLVDDEELRSPRRRRRYRRPDYKVQDRRLVKTVATHSLRTAADLVALLPGPLPSSFTTELLAKSLRSSAWFARKVAYTLRHCGASRLVGKQGNRLVYEPAMPLPAASSDLMVAC